MQVDGSYGEGGGQILRTAVAFSALTKKPVKITNIRANRPNPGIKPQHYVAIKSIKELCNAETEELEIGSSNLKFMPGDIKGGEYKLDIGTAGSTTLVFQACILSSLKTKKPITIRLTGGTDVKWSPSWDYFKYVFLPLIRKMGLSVNAKLIKRGYYPKGSGEAVIIINPCTEILPLQLDKKQEFTEVNGIIHIANLPDHIGTRMKGAVIKTLLKKNLKTSLKIEKTTSLSTGTGITLWTQSKDTVLGSTVLGEKGVSSEKVGDAAATGLIREIESGATLDVHAFDQMLPYMVMAKEEGESTCIVREVSSHAQTNVWLIKQFFNVQVESTQIDETVAITVR